MSFENPNFKNEPKSEREPINPYFLQEQVRLPKDQWDEKFKQLVEEKIKEKQKLEEECEDSPEVLREQIFDRYMNGLGLDEETIKGKKILDLGSGEGEFVQSLIEKGITSDAFGLDLEMDENAVEKKMKGHLFRGNFEEDLPVQDVDFIISVGAISSGISFSEEEMNMKRIFQNSLASLKQGGEIRIYPLLEAAQANPLKGLHATQEKWKELIEKISETQNLKCKIEPRNIKVIGYKKEVILESVLIVKRKEK